MDISDEISIYHGREIKPGKKTRKYNGYELSIYYGMSKTTGQPYISTIWKRQIRKPITSPVFDRQKVALAHLW